MTAVYWSGVSMSIAQKQRVTVSDRNRNTLE